jgi:VIT1/CCC1 family predicted Fe2+/Mn2+ transporter
MRKRETTAAYLRNFIFGLDDSLVSTVGLLAGITIADVEQKAILVTGAVLLFVEAFSMATGSFLSEHSAMDFLERREVPARRSIAASVVMFISYFGAGLIPLSPYVLFPVGTAFWLSITLSLIALFALGATGAAFSKTSAIKSGLRMFAIGGAAILVGVLVGRFTKLL